MNAHHADRVVKRLASVLALALCSSVAVAQERQSVKGTTVSLVPMPGFVHATNFAGFGNEKIQASVVVVEMAAAGYAEISTLFKDLETAQKQFASQNVKVTAREEIDTAAGRVPLVSGTQDAAGTTYQKWVALFKGARTVILTVQAPTAAGIDGAAVKTMLASVSLGAESSLADKLTSLPFTIEPRAPFRVVDTFGGSAVAMTVGEKDLDPDATQPLLIAAYQISAPVGTVDLTVAAERLLKQTKDFDAATIETRERTPFAGATGVLLAGTHAQKGRAKRFVQYMAIGESGRAVRMLVSADEGAFKDLQPAIAAIAQTVAFKPASPPAK
jgi:hypothetical protein